MCHTKFRQQKLETNVDRTIVETPKMPALCDISPHKISNVQTSCQSRMPVHTLFCHVQKRKLVANSLTQTHTGTSPNSFAHNPLRSAWELLQNRNKRGQVPSGNTGDAST